MPITLHTLKSFRKNKKVRRGRGNATGSGTYSGRGVKGQKARSGSSGLKEMSLRRAVQRIPKKRGFKAVRAKTESVTLGTLDAIFENGSVITPKLIRHQGIIKGNQVKIIRSGELTKKFSFKSCNITPGARDEIVKLGGTIA